MRYFITVLCPMHSLSFGRRKAVSTHEHAYLIRHLSCRNSWTLTGHCDSQFQVSSALKFRILSCPATMCKCNSIKHECQLKWVLVSQARPQRESYRYKRWIIAAVYWVIGARDMMYYVLGHLAYSLTSKPAY